MKAIGNFLVLARFTVLMGLLIISRFVSPQLTEGALSEQEYGDGEPAAAADDLSEGRETPTGYAAVDDMRNADEDSDGLGPQSSALHRAALRRGVHRTPGFGAGYLRHRPRP